MKLPFRKSIREFPFFFKTVNFRLPLEQGSDPRETLVKRISGDLQLFIFRPRKKMLVIFGRRFFVQKAGVSEELGGFERPWQIPRQRLLPVVRLF